MTGYGRSVADRWSEATPLAGVLPNQTVMVEAGKENFRETEKVEAHMY